MANVTIEALIADRDHWQRQAADAVANANARLEELRALRETYDGIEDGIEFYRDAAKFHRRMANRLLAEKEAPPPKPKIKYWLAAGMFGFAAGVTVMNIAIQIAGAH